jgi:rhodanese-related sulfurtransferase
MAKKKTTPISKRMQRRAEQRRKKRLTQIGVAAVGLIIVVGAFLALFDNNNPATLEVDQGSLPIEVSVDEAYEIYERGGYLLDVRTQEEWDEYHIPDTKLIPLDELKNRVDEVPRDQDVVVVCRSGNRSQEGRDILLQAGFTEVTHMNGGVNDWRTSGYPIE